MYLVYDTRIITGLPISNNDHFVNGIKFTQNSDLIIAVSGLTNMGLPQYKLGSYREKTLSAAFLISKLSKGASFDNEIKYSNLDAPIACIDYREDDAAVYDPKVNKTWQENLQFGPPSCPYSVSRPDNVLYVTPGSWYGHPNIQRGGGECAWIDQFDQLTADDKTPAAAYKKPMRTLKSPITGTVECRSNHFCRNLRKQLIMSTFEGGETDNMKVNGGVNGGSVLASPGTLSNTGGITFVEDASGNMIFPRLSQKNVFAMKPNISPSSDIFVISADSFRHGGSGGKDIIIGGLSFFLSFAYDSYA